MRPGHGLNACAPGASRPDTDRLDWHGSAAAAPHGQLEDPPLSKHALIVDDSKTACRILAQLLQHYGIESSSVHSAEEALEYLRHNRPDMIFLDHGMPGMDGLEAMRVIKGNPETGRIPVMMYTGKEGDVYVGQARALGAAGVLPKTQLQERLADALAKLEAPEPAPPPPPAAPAAEPGDVRALLRDVQSELSRQMYLILTEEQISRKGQMRGLQGSIETALERRLEELARRLEADQEIMLDNVAQQTRRRLRGLWLVTGLLLLLGLGLVWQLQGLDTGLDRLAARTEALAASRVGTTPGFPPPLAGAPTRTERAPTAEPGPRLLGLAPDGAGHQVKTPPGYLFRVDGAGDIGFPLPERHFLAPDCNGTPLVESPAGLVFQDVSGRLWYTPLDGTAALERPVSVMGPAGDCAAHAAGPTALRALQPNDPELTGVTLEQQPLDLSRLQ